METQELLFERVNLAPYNPRVELKPTDPEWQDIEASLEEFGQVLTLVWNKRTGTVVAGHQRIRIMRHRGHDRATFAVVDVDLEAEKRLNVILNKTGGRWVPAKLNELLGELRGATLSLERLGFTTVELQKILGSKPKRTAADPNAPAPGRPAIATTQPGDLLEFSRPESFTHRLICGDARDPETMRRLMGDTTARLVFTDPPYNVAYDNSTRGDGRRPLGTIQNDAHTPEDFADLLTRAFAHAAAHTMPEAALYTFLACATHIAFETSLIAAGWRVKQQIVWAKHFALSRADYHYAHEPLMYAAKAGQSTEWFGPRTETTLWNTAPEDLRKLGKERAIELLMEIRETASVWNEPRLAGNEYVHPTQKPTGLAKRALLNSSRPGEAVIDPFAGSGSTLIAAELEDRCAFLLELDRHNCDVIAKRWREVFPDGTTTRNGEPLS
jgi:DNA modification methylase